MVVVGNERLIGKCVHIDAPISIAQIGIKICETDCRNRGVGRKVLSILIS